MAEPFDHLRVLALPVPIHREAPSDPGLTDYDRAHMVTYARLIDADRAGHDWTEAAEAILCLDAAKHEAAALACWRSHLERARWITGPGLAEALEG